MAKLIYSALTSLDGYVDDENGNFDWTAPDEEVHVFVNDLMRPIGTHLYGRRMYDGLVAWESDDSSSTSRCTPTTSRRSGGRPSRAVGSGDVGNPAFGN